MMAQEAAPKEVAKGGTRRFLAYNKSFNCADVRVGDSVLLYIASNRRSTIKMAWPGDDFGH